MDNRQELIENLMESFRTIKRKMMEGYSHAKTPDGITITQGLVLYFIEKKGPVYVKDIAREFSTSSSAATQLVDGLVDRGLLVRTSNPQDRRETLLSLSKKAREHECVVIREKIFKQMARAFEALSTAELAAYNKLNKKIADSVSGKEALRK